MNGFLFFLMMGQVVETNPLFKINLDLPQSRSLLVHSRFKADTSLAFYILKGYSSKNQPITLLF